MQPFKYVLSLLESPSAFRSDWKGFLANQIAHILLIGALPVYLFGPSGFLWVLLLYAIWEWVQYMSFEAELDDCFEDAGFVFGGAMVTYTGYLEFAAPLVFFLLSGAIWRKFESNLTTED